MTKKCPTCGGDGIVVSEHTAAVDVERRLRSLVTPGSRSKAFKVEVSGKVAALIAGPGGTRLQELEETTKRRFFLVGKDGEHLDHFKVLDQGPLEKVAPSLPVDVGQEIDLKLGEVGLHDSHAGVGKVENVDVVVGGAAKLVGKKVKVRITALAEGMAWAELLSPVEPTLEPLTAESEAEKPTRAKRTTIRKKDDATVGDTDETVEDDTEEVEVDDEVELDDEAELEDEALDAGEAEPAEDGDAPATPKKRTRRGTRGGRNRKKKPALVAGEANGVAPANGVEPGESVAESDEPVAEAEEAEEAAEPVVAAAGHPLAGPPDRRRRGGRRRHGAPEEAHAARLARRQEPPQEADRRAGGRRGRGERRARERERPAARRRRAGACDRPDRAGARVRQRARANQRARRRAGARA